jgi:alpha-ribazole phosphatase
MSSSAGTRRIYFVRHGQSVANAGGVTMEHAAIPLTAAGVEQAARVASLLPVKPSRILVSKFVRARQTAQPYCARANREAEIHPLLHEFSALDPALLEGMTGEGRRPIASAYWQAADPSVRVGPQAETFLDFSARVAEFVVELPDLPGETVIFGHGIWFGMLCWKLQGLGINNTHDMQAFRRFQVAMRMPNCAVYTLLASSTRHWSWEMSEDTTAIGHAS